MMKDIEIRTATPFDAEELLGIYSYYIVNTAVTYELEVPFAEDFRRRSFAQAHILFKKAAAPHCQPSGAVVC